jgi:hypothetical protein
MRRFAAGLTILVFMTLASEVAAENNGTADPLGLISSAVIQPFWSAGADFTLIEVTSPVSDNLLHVVFFNSTCVRVNPSLPLFVSKNGIAVFDGDLFAAPQINGLAVIARSTDGVTAVPIPRFPANWFLPGPIHSRGHWVSFTTDSINEVDPIAVASAESHINAPPGNQQTYSPLRTANTFTNPQNIGAVQTTIFLVCPSSAVYSHLSPTAGFPATPPVTTALQVNIYNNEEKVFDTQIPCNCLTVRPLTGVLAAPFAGFYGTPPTLQPDSDVAVWYTELFAFTPTNGRFTGYRGETGSFLFGRMFNASSFALSDPAPLAIGPPFNP